ncbi:carboxylesterase [Bacterioplanes sanyensis]|uniref:Carboxylesterase n=1 Tax=Bacterioplanes sanyensis TaxID=1249553 RepID=A0A222FP01_9GAMM|nr:alpha/beta fold hydrolase [Bacterioplanes sanyensis]ASP40442.1 carboxylesterase [Bacterioplanes sanyensis]
MTINSGLNVLVDEPQQSADCAIIWLHGLGASPYDLQPLLPMLRRHPTLARLRGMLPQAPNRPVTINGGMVMPAWYDILAANPERVVEQTHLQHTAQQVQQLVKEAGVPAHRVIIAGFSQGGAVAYQAALTHQQAVAGLLCLSTYLAAQPPKPRTDVPLLAMHGSEDMVVPESLGRRSVDWCRQQGIASDYQTYPQGHEIGLTQIKDLSHWLASQLA